MCEHAIALVSVIRSGHSVMQPLPVGCKRLLRHLCIPLSADEPDQLCPPTRSVCTSMGNACRFHAQTMLLYFVRHTGGWLACQHNMIRLLQLLEGVGRRDKRVGCEGTSRRSAHYQPS